MLNLLLLPGMLCDDASWRAQLTDLADVAVPRVMAYGGADSFEAMADAVLVEAPERFALAGHSMGGRVAQEIYRKAPQRVIALALLATDYRGHADEAARAAESARRDGIIARVHAEGMGAFARFWAPQVIAPANMANADLVAGAVAMMARHSAAALEAETLAGLTRPDRSALLATIACPTLICSGDQDTLRPVAIHQDMAARIPSARLVVIEGSGHMVAMERPDAVSAAIRDWLARAAG
jgi:pimeloyl-ACP methyl ester carboxylesterase